LIKSLAIKKITELAHNYRTLFEKSSVSFQRKPNHIEIANDWWLSLISFFDRVFFQGRNDILSGRYERATIKALETFFGDTGAEKIKQLENYGYLDWKNYGYYYKKSNTRRVHATPCESHYSKALHDCLQNSYKIIHEGKQMIHETGKTRDNAMVISTLQFVVKLKDLNILRYSINKIKAYELPKLDEELRKIYQVGEKTSSLFLRDTVFFYDLKKYLDNEDYEILQPVDTWVYQMAQKLNIIDKDMKIDELKEKRYILTQAAFEADVSPIEFNQGLWYLATHAIDLLISEYERL